MTWVDVCAVVDIPVLGARRVSRAHGMDVAPRTAGPCAKRIPIATA